MKSTYSLLCFCLSLTPLLAYPVDYNETTAEITSNALKELVSLISDNPFTALVQQYNNDINDINSRTYGKMKINVDNFNARLSQVEDSATKADANITTCLENLNLLTPEVFYQKYTEECVNPSRALGLNLMSLGYNKQTVEFYKKYDELMTYFNGCLHGSDPSPQICAGIVESTLQEVNRILPAVKANPLHIQREFEHQRLALAYCAYEHVSSSSKRLEVEFRNVKTCILEKIDAA
ncbi:uncharacterized protein LOC108909601 [Anoplophora glabripennis]|uniref:uncharacterized protein LOC108909601 n=1 Tax=Anoplophora glabripennis TaxID=217634 RepID=UPI000874631A|nr:uncharacterized protein LOC108909601 [Anoplophora glabripennis]